MNRYFIYFLILTLAIIIQLTGCSFNNTKLSKIKLPEELNNIMEKNKDKMFPQPNPNLAEIIKRYQTPNLDIETDSNIAEHVKNAIKPGVAGYFNPIKQIDASLPKYLSHTEIINELDFLFNLLKYSYSAYQYFGGDDVFHAVKQLVVRNISKSS